MTRHPEERRNLRRALYLGVLSFVLLIVFVFFGFPTVARFAAFVSDLVKSGKPVEISDNTPPAPPRFDNLPDVTSELNIEVKGVSENGATVTLFFNAEEVEIVANKSGGFTFSFDLLDGENSLSAKAKDLAGNESQETEVFVIVHDSEPPFINLTSPSNGASFFGSQERQVTIEGETEEGASLTINDRVVSVDSEGKFAYTTTLSEGENSFKVKVVDAAGNEKEASLTLQFSL